jgi:DNA-binding response OmpR family regulator
MKVLIAEDEPEIWKPYKIALESRKHKVVIAEDGEECLREYKKELSRKQKDGTEYLLSTTATPFDAVVLDYRMPKKDGMEVAKEILAVSLNRE